MDSFLSTLPLDRSLSALAPSLERSRTSSSPSFSSAAVFAYPSPTPSTSFLSTDSPPPFIPLFPSQRPNFVAPDLCVRANSLEHLPLPPSSDDVFGRRQSFIRPRTFLETFAPPIVRDPAFEEEERAATPRGTLASQQQQHVEGSSVSEEEEYCEDFAGEAGAPQENAAAPCPMQASPPCPYAPSASRSEKADLGSPISFPARTSTRDGHLRKLGPSPREIARGGRPLAGISSRASGSRAGPEGLSAIIEVATPPISVDSPAFNGDGEDRRRPLSMISASDLGSPHAKRVIQNVLGNTSLQLLAESPPFRRWSHVTPVETPGSVTQRTLDNGLCEPTLARVQYAASIFSNSSAGGSPSGITPPPPPRPIRPPRRRPVAAINTSLQASQSTGALSGAAGSHSRQSYGYGSRSPNVRAMSSLSINTIASVEGSEHGTHLADVSDQAETPARTSASRQADPSPLDVSVEQLERSALLLRKQREQANRKKVHRTADQFRVRNSGNGSDGMSRSTRSMDLLRTLSGEGLQGALTETDPTQDLQSAHSFLRKLSSSLNDQLDSVASVTHQPHLVQELEKRKSPAEATVGPEHIRTNTVDALAQWCLYPALQTPSLERPDFATGESRCETRAPDIQAKPLLPAAPMHQRKSSLDSLMPVVLLPEKDASPFTGLSTLGIALDMESKSGGRWRLPTGLSSISRALLRRAEPAPASLSYVPTSRSLALQAASSENSYRPARLSVSPGTALPGTSSPRLSMHLIPGAAALNAPSPSPRPSVSTPLLKVKAGSQRRESAVEGAATNAESQHAIRECLDPSPKRRRSLGFETVASLSGLLTLRRGPADAASAVRAVEPKADEPRTSNIGAVSYQDLLGVTGNLLCMDGQTQGVEACGMTKMSQPQICVTLSSPQLAQADGAFEAPSSQPLAQVSSLMSSTSGERLHHEEEEEEMEILEVLINDHGVSSRSSSYGAGAQHLPLKERQRSSSPSQSSVTSTSETPLATSTPPRPSPSPSPSLSALTPSRPSRSTRRLSQAAPAHPPQPVPVKALISTVPFPCSSPASSADEYVFGGLDDGHYALHERYDDVFCDPQGSTRGPKESTPVRPSCVPAWARSDGMHGYSDRDSDSDSNSDSDSDSAHTCSSGSISRPPTAFEAPRPESATTAGSDVEMDGKDTWRAWLDWTAEPRSAPAGLQE